MEKSEELTSNKKRKRKVRRKLERKMIDKRTSNLNK